MHTDGTFDVIFEDKSKDEHIERRLLRLNDVYWRKQIVEFLSNEHWYLGRIWDQVCQRHKPLLLLDKFD